MWLKPISIDVIIKTVLGYDINYDLEGFGKRYFFESN